MGSHVPGDLTMGLFSNTTKSRSQLTPWEGAMPGLESSMDIAQSGLNDPWQLYGGELVQDLDPYQQQALQQMGAWGQGRGGNLADFSTAVGNTGLTGALGGYQDVMGAGTPQVGQLDQGYAQSIADNPYTESMIDAALRDSTRQLTEQVLPGVAMNAWAGGALGGSEQNQANQIALRGYQDRAADVGAGIRNQNYGRGLDIANQQATMNPGFEMGRLNQNLAASGGMGNLGQFGVGQGYGMGLQNMQTQLGAGNIMQNQGQNEIDAAMQQYYLGQNLPFMQGQAGMGMFAPLAAQFGTQRGRNTQSMGVGNVLAGLGGQLGGAWLMRPQGNQGTPNPTTQPNIPGYF